MSESEDDMFGDNEVKSNKNEDNVEQIKPSQDKEQVKDGDQDTTMKSDEDHDKSDHHEEEEEDEEEEEEENGDGEKKHKKKHHKHHRSSKKSKETKEERKERHEKRRKEKEEKRKKKKEDKKKNGDASDQDMDTSGADNATDASDAEDKPMKQRSGNQDKFGFETDLPDDENDGYGDYDEKKEEEFKEVIRPPIHLTHINSTPLPNAKIMKLKVLNILGIQPKPFDSTTFDIDEATDEGGRRSNVESVIRWRWALDDNGRPTKESNTRLVKWSDGSTHLIIGSESLEVKEQELGADQFYIYTKQDDFIECQGKIDSKMNIRPTKVRSKAHQRLKESIMSRTQKVGKIKSVVTKVDPEREKEARERKEEGRIRDLLKSEKEKNKSAKKMGLNPQYLEGDSGDEDGGRGRDGYGYNDDTGFIDDDSQDDSYDSQEDESYDSEEDEDDLGDFIEQPKRDNNKRKDRNDGDREQRDQENTNKLMKIQQSTKQSNDSPKSNNNNNNKQKSATTTIDEIFGEEDNESDDQQVIKKPSNNVRRSATIEDDDE